MLNYEILTGEKAPLLEKEPVAGTGNFNPFPGLRAFGIEESHLFFGREGQADELLEKLSNNNFVAVMGFSGSGKSSLLYCGLIPLLYGGFMIQAGANWKIIVTRPGSSPIENLTQSIYLADPENAKNPDDKAGQLKKKVISSVLRSSSTGLSEAVKQFTKVEGGNLMILVDQFEELFRYRDSDAEPFSVEESSLYVSLLLETVQENPANIYVALAMRSEYIGACAQFPVLTEMINNSNYLVPQMTREQKKMAVQGPIAVGGGKISPRLVKMLLNDMGDNQDQLPVMQHALMRTWNYWIENREQDEPIDVRHYNAVGKVSQALSLHANEAYDEIPPEKKYIAEVLFKSLTEKVSDNVGVRRAVHLSEIAQIASVPIEDVIEVVEVFRKPGRSLLMPPSNVPLEPGSLLEISHESLMRIWTRLKVWVEEEYDSSQMYKRLSEAAGMYQIGRTGLWRPPDLQLALNWQKKQKPSLVWAQRYDEAFERAMVFLDTSRTTYVAEQKNQEMLQKRLLNRTKLVAMALGIAVIITVVFFVFAVIRQGQAEDNYKLATENEKRALEQKEEAERNKEEADSNRKIAQQKSEALSQANADLEEALIETEKQKNYAELQFIEANRQAEIARKAKEFAESQKTIANENAELASLQFHRAERLFYQQLAQAIAVKSLQIEDKELKGLLAFQAFQFNDEYGGSDTDPYVYEALYYALSQLEGDGFNTMKIHRNAVKSVEFSKLNNSFFSTGSDGKIMKSSLDNIGGPYEKIGENNYGNRVLKLDQSEKWLINGTDSSRVEIYDLTSEIKEPVRIEGHRGFIYDIVKHPSSEGFYTLGSDRAIRFVDTESSKLIKENRARFKTMDIHPSGTYLVAGSVDGQVVRIDLQNNEERILLEEKGVPIHSLKFNPEGGLLAIGDEKGLLRIMKMDFGEEVYILKGHKSRINHIEFSNFGDRLASASFDGTIQIWEMDNLEGLPIVLRDNDAYVWDISFNASDDFMIAGCNDGEVRVWSVDLLNMASLICDKLIRNMSEEEWNRYIGRGVKYRNTCQEKP